MISWPYYEAYISKNWKDTRNLVETIVVRKSNDDRFVLASFIIDLGCLGVKDALYKFYPTPDQYKSELIRRFLSTSRFMKTDVNLVAKIIQEAISYASQFELSPHRDYYKAAPLIQDAHPELCKETIPLGHNGKPLFIAGPHDNVRYIIDKLTKHVGPNGFNCTIPF